MTETTVPIINDVSIPVGSTVRTPTGRYARIVKYIYGARGDIPRCLILYLDEMTGREYARVQPQFLKQIDGKKD